MINALGVLGWGVGGIEAEAVMLGQPIYMTAPQVIGVRLSGALQSGVTATDLVLTMTERLRKHGVVGKFIEFFGPGLGSLSGPGHHLEHVARVRRDRIDVPGRRPDAAYCVTPAARPSTSSWSSATPGKGLFRNGAGPEPAYTETLDFDLSGVEPSLAGRAARRIACRSRGSARASPTPSARAKRRRPRRRLGRDLGHHVVHEHLEPGPHDRRWAGGAEGRRARPNDEALGEDQPGARLPGRDRLPAEGCAHEPLEALGFNLVGFGCTTCIGNSGPLPEDVAGAIERDDLKVAAVLSGNRNFEARIHPAVRANYLARHRSSSHSPSRAR